MESNQQLQISLSYNVVGFDGSSSIEGALDFVTSKINLICSDSSRKFGVHIIITEPDTSQLGTNGPLSFMYGINIVGLAHKVLAARSYMINSNPSQVVTTIKAPHYLLFYPDSIANQADSQEIRSYVNKRLKSIMDKTLTQISLLKEDQNSWNKDINGTLIGELDIPYNKVLQLDKSILLNVAPSITENVLFPAINSIPSNTPNKQSNINGTQQKTPLIPQEQYIQSSPKLPSKHNFGSIIPESSLLPTNTNLINPNNTCISEDGNSVFIKTSDVNDIDVVIIGLRSNVERARIDILVLLDELLGLSCACVNVDYKIHSLLSGVKRVNVDNIMCDTQTSIYMPTPFVYNANSEIDTNYSNSIWITGPSNNVKTAEKALLNLFNDRLQIAVTKQITSLTRKIDWLLLSQSDKLMKIMQDFGVYFDFPVIGSGVSTFTVVGADDQHLEDAIKKIMLLLSEVYVCRVTINQEEESILLNKDISKHIATYSLKFGAEIECSKNHITIFGSKDNVKITAKNIANNEVLLPLINQIVFNVELAIEHKEFINGKKNGKINKIIKQSGCKIGFDELYSEVNMLIEVASPLFAKVYEGLNLLEDEMPAEISFYIPEVYHKRIIGVGGKNIQRIMKKYAVYVKFSNAEEYNALCGCLDNADNVIARTPAKNINNLKALKSSIIDLSNVYEKSKRTIKVSIPRQLHRIIIGFKSGIFIRELIKITRTEIKFPLRESGSNDVLILGNENQLPLAERMLSALTPVLLDWTVFAKNLLNTPQQSAQFQHKIPFSSPSATPMSPPQAVLTPGVTPFQIVNYLFNSSIFSNLSSLFTQCTNGYILGYSEAANSTSGYVSNTGPQTSDGTYFAEMNFTALSSKIGSLLSASNTELTNDESIDNVTVNIILQKVASMNNDEFNIDPLCFALSNLVKIQSITAKIVQMQGLLEISRPLENGSHVLYKGQNPRAAIPLPASISPASPPAYLPSFSPVTPNQPHSQGMTTSTAQSINPLSPGLVGRTSVPPLPTTYEQSYNSLFNNSISQNAHSKAQLPIGSSAYSSSFNSDKKSSKINNDILLPQGTSRADTNSINGSLLSSISIGDNGLDDISFGGNQINSLKSQQNIGLKPVGTRLNNSSPSNSQMGFRFSSSSSSNKSSSQSFLGIGSNDFFSNGRSHTSISNPGMYNTNSTKKDLSTNSGSELDLLDIESPEILKAVGSLLLPVDFPPVQMPMKVNYSNNGQHENNGTFGLNSSNSSSSNGPTSLENGELSNGGVGGVTLSDSMINSIILLSKENPRSFEPIEFILQSIGTSEYIPLFKAHDIDFTSFLTLQEHDLREIGIHQFGARRRIHTAIRKVEQNYHT